MAEEADRLVERAIESVLDQVPGAVDTSLPEGTAAKMQPWAETAAPAGRNKRPLDEVLEELAERVRASPDARAGAPRARHPAIAFFDRFTPGRGEAAESASPGGKRRRRRRSGGRATGGAAPAAAPAPPSPEGESRGRRRRRGRSRQTAPASPPPAQPATEGTAASRATGGRRRRGRRGRGGRGGGASPAT